MSGWLLGIAGIIIIGVIVEILLTDSPMSKFIRSIFGFFVLLVIVAPIPGFFRNGIEVGGNIDYDWELIGTINALSLESATQRVERALDQAGFQHVLVTITKQHNVPSFRVERVFINAIGVWHNHTNINVESEIIRIVTVVLGITQEQITYVG